MNSLHEVPDYLLAGISDDGWFKAPAGKWTPAEIVDHVATAIETSAKGFASRADKPAMTRRPRTPFQRVANMLVLGLRWFPVRRQAPEMTRPAARPERAATEAKLRAACADYLAMQQRLGHRAGDMFLKHPVLGDLTIDEFARFHVSHAMHHRKQIVERMR